MVMAPVQSIQMIGALIADYDRIRPITSELRLFPLQNSDAETMATQLAELFDGEASSGTDSDVRNQLVYGNDLTGDLDIAGVGQRLRFAADTRTNTLIDVQRPAGRTPSCRSP